MIKYLFWSYLEYLDRLTLTGGQITSIPQCGQSFDCKERVLAAKLMRVSSWLQDTSLFKQAWLHVIKGKLNWWWSVEICLFTVGYWAMHLKQQGHHKGVPYVWAYMVLGQTTAISVAMNLFEAALASRSQILVQDEKKQVMTSSEEDDSPLPTPLQETNIQLQDQPTQSTPIKQSKTVTQFITLSSPLRTGDMLFRLFLVLFGLGTVYKMPTTLSSVLIMHLSPMILVLPIHLSSRIVPRRMRWLLSNSSIYLTVALLSLVIKIKAHGDVRLHYDKLVPTFVSHPAQSSISADNLCVALSIMVQLYDENKKSNYLLILLTPILGPSVVMSFHAYLEAKRMERLQEKRYESVETNSKDLQGQDVLIKTKVTSTTYRKNTQK